MIQTSCTVCFWDFLQDTEARCLTVSLSYSSASEDLGCRRGDFSRKHYGSVELVSPTHSALVCSHLFLSQQLLCPPLVLSSLVLSGLLPGFVVVRMSAVRGRQWVVTFWVWSSGVASKMLLCLDAAEKEKKKKPLQPERLCRRLLSCWVIVASGEWICVSVSWLSVHPDSPEEQEVLEIHTGMELPSRDILFFFTQTLYITYLTD